MATNVALAGIGRFERPRRFLDLPVFKTGLFNHLSTSPYKKASISARLSECLSLFSCNVFFNLLLPSLEDHQWQHRYPKPYYRGFVNRYTLSDSI